ncbi:PrsW family intramembrane metalloprotease [Candidatus Parcubacteria bacterium]|nr:PrsW family intramembrane metalloprotease [Candidatus Parcubacteria bacterium]
MSNTSTIIYALLGGILPALVWLFFWLREDSKRPEPRGRLAESFLFGMLAVLLVLPLQKWVAHRFPGLGLTPFLLWAAIEETFKFIAAYVAALRTKDDDEPADPLIYMITAALGFVALENALFIWNPLLEQNVSVALSTGGLRFLGASLLHILASGAIGFALALSFYKSKGRKILYGLVGLAAAVAIHTAFNLYLVAENGSGTLRIFSAVWLGVAILLLCFEKAKSIAPRRG